jgi:hypothetical protein
MPSKKPGSRSISSRQRDYLKTLHLDQIGSGKDSFGPVQLDQVEEILIGLAEIFVKAASDGLNVAHAIDTAALHDSIQFDAVQYDGRIYAVEISVLDYYKFVDEGVKGLVSTPPGAESSPYKFRSYFVSRKFKNSIRKWLIRHSLKATARPVRKDNFKYALGTERKAKPFSEVAKTDALAYAVAMSIKKKGIKATHFWKKAEEAIREQITAAGADMAQVIFINELTRK